MSGELPTVIPLPTPITQLDVSWPPLQGGLSEGGAFATACDNRWGGLGSTATLWSATTGAGASLMSRMHNNEIVCGYWTNGVSRNLIGFPVMMPLSVQNWPATFRMPEHLRVWRLAFLMTVTGAPTEQTGVQFVASAATVGGYATAAGNSGAFGVAFTAASGLVLFAKRGGGTYTTTPLTVPSNLEVFSIELQMLAASGAGAASLNVFVNGQAAPLPASFASWGGASVLPRYSDGGLANCNKFVAVAQANNGAGSVMALGGLRAQMGDFLVNGAQA